MVYINNINTFKTMIFNIQTPLYSKVENQNNSVKYFFLKKAWFYFKTSSDHHHTT